MVFNQVTMIPSVVQRYVAGGTVDEAIGYVEEANERGFGVTVNQLGEDYGTVQPILDDTKNYIRLMDAVSKRGLNASVSVKPSQLGLGIRMSVFEEFLNELLDANKGVFIWMDMEEESMNDGILEQFRKIRREDLGVTVRLQGGPVSERLDSVKDHPGAVRLVRQVHGWVQEGTTSEYFGDDKRREILETVFREFEPDIAVESHDREFIETCVGLSETYGRDLEIQMLKGVNPELQEELVENNRVVVYAPFGERWMSYFKRRMEANKKHVKKNVSGFVDGVDPGALDPRSYL
ncbi:MAG: proline dehydrogenase [Halobacteria archaeon]